MPSTSSTSSGQCVAYALPVITTAWLITPMGIIQGLYAKLYAIPLSSIALLILIARLFDAITDPLIGHFADRYYAKTSSVKPFLWTGGVLFIVSSCLLYIPVVQVTTSYLLVCFLLIYLAWTLFEIPHLAWANTLAPTSRDKTRIFSYRTMAGYSGILLFYVVPLLPFFDTQDITPATLKVSVVLANVLMLIFLFICLSKTPAQSRKVQKHPILNNVSNYENAPVKIQSSQFRQTLVFITCNRPLLLFISAYVLIGISASMWYGLVFIYVDTYLNMGEKFAKMSLLSFVVGVLVVPVWYRLAVYLDKKYALLVAVALMATSFMYTVSLTPNNSSFNELVSLSVMQAIGLTGMSTIIPAMLAEVADYGTWKTRVDRSNTCFALLTLTNKTCGALGTALALGIAGWYGFEVTSTVHTEAHIQGLHVAMVWLPLALISIAVVFVYLNPINARRHRVIRNALDRRAVQY